MQNAHHISLAVLPFEDLSLQKDLGIFCRSFGEDLITELSCFRQFRVFKLTDSQEIPTRLINGYFVQGIFRYEKEVVRINVQLFESDSKRLVWGNRLEGQLTGLNEIQDFWSSNVFVMLKRADQQFKD